MCGRSPRSNRSAARIAASRTNVDRGGLVQGKAGLLLRYGHELGVGRILRVAGGRIDTGVREEVGHAEAERRVLDRRCRRPARSYVDVAIGGALDQSNQD